ncbi:MAG: hypothetical protein DRP42_05050 [Tenericutes bacterium]|nr:MAG: hypothetical protein DRP42_05050 [Mycoplasmatota bacterium]
MTSKDTADLLTSLGEDPSDHTIVPTMVEDEYADVQEVGMASQEVQEAAKGSLDFLAALIMPTVFKYCFPSVFLAVWDWLVSYVNMPRSFPQLALGLPRGFGKTTLIKIFLVYTILFTKKKFLLIISAKATLAENILADVVDMLEEPNIKRVFGDWKVGVEKDTLGLKKFGYRGRTIIIAALGAGSSLRGLNLKNERPDVMVFDDVQSAEQADSEVVSMQLEKWMLGTAMKAKSPHGCMFLFIANMYPTKWSLLRRLKKNPKWTKFIAGGILADGTSLWEELQPIEQLMNEFENDLAAGRPEIFYAEVLNDENASANTLVDLSKLPDSPRSEGDIPAGNFIIIDPATDKLGSDEVSIGYFEVHDAYPVLMELEEGRFSPGDTIRIALKYALTHNCRLIVIEANAYQYSLLYWFKHICDQTGITGIEAVDIYSGTKSKNSRILTMFKSLIAGEIFVEEPAQAATYTQITGFNPLRRDNTDGILDLLTYAPRVIAEFGEYVIASNIIESQEYEAIEVPEWNTAF